MEITNLLHFTSREDLRLWLEKSHDRERKTFERWPEMIDNVIPYIEVVEEALCFGWIDSTVKRLPNGHLAQRLSPRRKGSHWTELNKERCRALEQRGLMTDAGRRELEKATNKD